MRCFRKRGKGETGTSEFMPTVWHQIHSFQIVNNLNPGRAVVKHTVHLLNPLCCLNVKLISSFSTVALLL